MIPTRLGDVATVRSGYAFKSADWIERGVPVIKIANVKDGWVPLEGCSFVSEDVAGSARAFELRRGDLLISMTGHIGQVAKVRDEGRMLLNQRVGRFTIKDPGRLDAEFLFHWLRVPEVRAMFEAHAYGAAQPNISPSLIEQQTIDLPALPTQRRIASVLGAYDDLIEVNRRRIAVMEEMARRLFEEWFIVRNLSGHAERTGDAAPWHRASVGEAVRFVRGRSYRSADLADSGGLPFVNLKCMLRDGGFRRDGLKRYVGEYKREHTLRAGDIVVAVTDMTQDRRIVGQAARIPRSDEPVAVMSMDLVKVVPTQSLLPLFCYYWLRYSGFAGVAAQHANGANVLHLSPSAMAGLPIEIPPIALQRAFCELAQPLTDAAEVLGLSNERLAASRDLLLPRLISGDLPVTAAERELEAVA